MLDRLTGLTVFAKVVESGGFSAAARRLGLSPAMVSTHVRTLEDRLGVRLLNRTTRRISLTEIGRAYYEQTTRALAVLEAADAAATARQASPTGTLRMNCPYALSPLVGPILADLLDRNPGLRIEAVMSDHMIDLVEQGFDLAVGMVPMPDSRMIARRLSGYRHVLCAAPAYLDRLGRPGELAELVGHNCLRHASYPFGDDWRFDGPGGEAVVRVHGNLLTNSVHLLHMAALRGHGLVLLPQFVVADDLAQGRLEVVLPGHRPRQLTLEVVYPQRHHLSAKVRAVIDLLVERLAAGGVIDRLPPAG